MLEQGSVILVGGGPGDPGLLTLRGKEALQSADVVLYDRLVGDEILAMIPDSAEAVDVGKSSGRHPISQHRINALILDHVREGKRVVRLKGGDPYLFGRGAEELEAVVAEGIPFEVVPGVTSAIAAPAYGGIPVSHREMASSVHIITGHRRRGEAPDLDFESLVRVGGTLIFLMGIGSLPEIAGGLLAAGMPAETPAALVENGTRPDQRKLTAPLAKIAERAQEERFQPPSVFVVGEVCSLAAELDWHAARPLYGKRVLVTRPKALAGTLTARLRELGCGVVEYPCIRTEPLPVEIAVFAGLANFKWIVFTSAVGVQRFFEELAAWRMDIRAMAGVRFAVVGEKTAAALVERGIYPALMPDTYDSAHLAQAMLEQPDRGRTLLFRAREGTPELPAALRAGGFAVEDVAAYETVCAHPDSDRVRELLEAGGVDCATFTSASTVHGFARSLPGLDYAKVVAVCIGAETASAAKEYGMRVKVSKSATIESLIDCILKISGT